MKYLLDTNVASEGIAKRRHEPVIAWVSAQPVSTLYLSTVTIAEIAFGVGRLDPSHRRDELEHWLRGLEVRFGDRILPVSHQVALACGTVRANAERLRRTMPMIDAFLAATADVHELTLVTRNVEDFKTWGGPVLNPWGD